MLRRYEGSRSVTVSLLPIGSAALSGEPFPRKSLCILFHLISLLVYSFSAWSSGACLSIRIIYCCLQGAGIIRWEMQMIAVQDLNVRQECQSRVTGICPIRLLSWFPL